MTHSPFIYRPATSDDIEACVDLGNTVSAGVIGEEPYTRASLASEWSMPGFDIEQDTLLAINSNGQIVGVKAFWNHPPHVSSWNWFIVHPNFTDRGIERHFLKEAEAQARAHISRAPADAIVRMMTSAYRTEEVLQSLLQKHGFRHSATFWLMRIEFASTPAPYTLPDGLTIRPLNLPTEKQIGIGVIEEAFKDHRNHVDRPIEQVLALWDHWLFNKPDFDPHGFLVAEIDGQIVGCSVCANADNDPAKGYVEELGVLRDYRGRGVGKTLLHASFHYLYNKGKSVVELGVDANSLTGAQGLYTRAGMHIRFERYMYEKVLRDGKDYVVSSLDG